MEKVIAVVRIVRNAHKEYVCLAYDADNKRLPECDYYTDSKSDAIATMHAMLNRVTKGVNSD